MAKTMLTVLIIVLIVAAVALFFLYRYGQKLQLRQAESQKFIDAYTQVMQLLIIDKKKMKLKEAPFPEQVYEQASFWMKMMSVYVVKAKAGPRVVNLMCDKRIFESIAPKTTIKAKVSGAYISEVLKGEVLSDKEKNRRRKEREKAEKKAKKSQK